MAVHNIESVRPEEFEKHKKARQRINTLFYQFFSAKHTFTPGQIQTFVLMHNSLDRTAQDYALPVTSERCPRSYVAGKINCVLALMEALVRAFWRKDYAKIDMFGRELVDVMMHGLTEFEVLGTQRTGYYLFRRGA
jgi:hypothetical protein